MGTPDEPIVQELRVLHLELRTAAAESRARDAELRQQMTDLRAQVDRRLDTMAGQLGTLIDAIADLRREYHTHYHPPTDGAAE